jgi:hypothetical protein
MAQAVPASGGPGASDNVNAAVRLFTAGLPSPQCPIWYYQDLQGQLQVGWGSSGVQGAEHVCKVCCGSCLIADSTGVHCLQSTLC